MTAATSVKAHPFILDDALASRPPFLDRQRFEQVSAVARRAERFLFSADASALIGRFVADCPDLILQHRQFARPPYSEMYIELQRPFIDQLARGYYRDPVTDLLVPTPSGDMRLGYLISGSRIYVFSHGRDKPGDPLSSTMTQIFWTWAAPGQRAPFETPERGRPVLLTPDTDGGEAAWYQLAISLGTAVHKVTGEEMREALLGEARPHVFPAVGEIVDRSGAKGRATLHAMMYGTSGDIRNVWATLLWLNRPAHTVITNQAAGRRFYRGKPVAFKAHHVVEIDLHRHRSIRRAFTLSGERLPPRRHSVRGAFHHSGGQFACSHDWPLTPDTGGHWQCRRCGRLRWWVKEHRRGKGAMGVVQHTYSVTTGEAVA